MTLHTFEARRVLKRVRGGSSSPVVVETDGGLFLGKLSGAGHGVRALVAEILVAELAELLGLSVPERVLIQLPPDVPSDDKNDELRDLLARSVGTNVGFRLLADARIPRAPDLDALDDEFALRVLWLDVWTMNLDRTKANPNVLIWKHRPWLIDHGSALPFHYDWSRVSQDSPGERWDPSSHLFADRLSRLSVLEPAIASAVTREALQRATAVVPNAFLTTVGPVGDPMRVRAFYETFLWQRARTLR